MANHIEVIGAGSNVYKISVDIDQTFFLINPRNLEKIFADVFKL